jgi:hypothetical protein
MSSVDNSHPNRNRRLSRSIVIPVFFFGSTIIAGTIGYSLYLQTLPAYADASTIQLGIEGFFRSLGFLVLAMGTLGPVDTIPLLLITISRVSGFLFFFYAALTGISILFAERLLPLRIEIWAHLGHLPGFDPRGHVIVCGIGDDGYALAKEALNNGWNVVAIDTEINDRTAELESIGASVIKGDASHIELLEHRARLRHAEDIFVTTNNDATNSDIVEAINQWKATNNSGQLLELTARIEDERLRRALHQEANTTKGIYFRTYDVPEATARELLARAAIDNINSLDERVHVWLVGWTPLSRALLEQLLHLMHYPTDIERQVTIAVTNPAAVEQEIATIAPGIDPDWWDDTEMRELVATLFPQIDIHTLPESDMELLSDRLQLYDTLEENDRLTIFADGTDARPLRALLSSWAGKLDDLARRNNLDAKIYYRKSVQSTWQPGVSIVNAESYDRFGDGCSIRAVRGEQRDHMAQRLALIYYYLYADTLVTELPEPETIPEDFNQDMNSIMSWLESIPPEEIDRYANAVWQSLPEYQRESNRHAADHITVKQRMAKLLAQQNDESRQSIVQSLAKTEHHRWCAEKILNGWEPLPDTETERWETDIGEEQLRRQRYHPDLRSISSLQAEMEDEWDKDVTQVSAILEHPTLIGHQISDDWI